MKFIGNTHESFEDNMSQDDIKQDNNNHLNSENVLFEESESQFENFKISTNLSTQNNMKVTLSLEEQTGKISAQVEDQDNQIHEIDLNNLPKEFTKITNKAIFKAYFKNACAKIKKFENGKFTLEINQPLLGGMNNNIDQQNLANIFSLQILYEKYEKNKTLNEQEIEKIAEYASSLTHKDLTLVSFAILGKISIEKKLNFTIKTIEILADITLNINKDNEIRTLGLKLLLMIIENGQKVSDKLICKFTNLDTNNEEIAFFSLSLFMKLQEKNAIRLNQISTFLDLCLASNDNKNSLIALLCLQNFIKHKEILSDTTINQIMDILINENKDIPSREISSGILCLAFKENEQILDLKKLKTLDTNNKNILNNVLLIFFTESLKNTDFKISDHILNLANKLLDHDSDSNVAMAILAKFINQDNEITDNLIKKLQKILINKTCAISLKTLILRDC